MKPAAKSRKSKTSEQCNESAATCAAAPDALQRVASIAAAAYFRAEGRGFAPGGELDDWLAAETEFDARHSLRA